MCLTTVQRYCVVCDIIYLFIIVVVVVCVIIIIIIIIINALIKIKISREWSKTLWEVRMPIAPT